MVLNIISWNARGLLNVEKFEKMKELCKEANVILLQETNWKKLRILKAGGMEMFFITMGMTVEEEVG